MTRSGFAVIVAALVGSYASVLAQDHVRLAPASGIAHGIPRICADANIASVANGAWSSASTWSTGKVSGRGHLDELGDGVG